MNTEKYLVKAFGDNQEGTNIGLKKFFELCGAHGDGTIVVPTFQNLKSKMFVTALGDDLANKLIKDREITSQQTTIRLCSSNTLLKGHTHSNVYLALWGTPDMIEDIESNCFGAKAITLVTWLPSDSEEWEKNNKVTIIYDDKKTSPSF